MVFRVNGEFLEECANENSNEKKQILYAMKGMTDQVLGR